VVLAAPPPVSLRWLPSSKPKIRAQPGHHRQQQHEQSAIAHGHYSSKQ
jgi:hypothetical protein